MLDKDLRLWLVSNDNKYGVLDKNGNTLIHLELDKVGIDTSVYSSRVDLNGMLLFNNFIPAQRNGLWGAYDKTGKLILPFEYKGIGGATATSKDKIGENVLVINEVNGIVVEKNTNKYGVVNSLGNIIVQMDYDRIYSQTTGGVTDYYVQKGEDSIKMILTKPGDAQNNNTNTTNTVSDENNI